MMLHPTLDKLRDLRLDGMLAALNDQEMLPNPGVMSFEERLGLQGDYYPRKSQTQNPARQS